MLERIHREQQDAHSRLKDMENHFHELEAIIQRGKQQAVCKDEEVDRSGLGGAERYLKSCFAPPLSALLHWPFHCLVQTNQSSKNSLNLQIFCVSCGQSVSMHVAMRHMERCFAKVGELAGGRWSKDVFAWVGSVGRRVGSVPRCLL